MGFSIEVRCPSCYMTAQRTDLRHLQPVATEEPADLRLCRNCGDVFPVGPGDGANRFRSQSGT